MPSITNKICIIVHDCSNNIKPGIRGGVLARGRSWPREHILKSLALASKPQVLENCPVLGSRTALFVEPLKFRWKTPETSRKICEHLFCFPHLEHRRRQGKGGQGPLPIEILTMAKM